MCLTLESKNLLSGVKLAMRPENGGLPKFADLVRSSTELLFKVASCSLWFLRCVFQYYENYTVGLYST